MNIHLKIIGSWMKHFLYVAILAVVAQTSDFRFERAAKLLTLGEHVMSRPASALPGIYSGQYPADYERYNSQYGGQLEAIGWQWWDTQTFTGASTTSLINFFGATRSTVDLSNMEVAGQLAAPKAFLCRAIRFYVKNQPRSAARAASGSVQTGGLADVELIINTGVMQLTIGNKVYAQVPLWMLTAGAGIYGGIAAEGATADPGGVVDWGQNGWPDPRAVYTLAKPIFIAPQINFNARIDWAATVTIAAASYPLTLVLDGDLLRPVQ